MTALTAAAARAAHLIVDREPRIFTDSQAATLLGDQADTLLDYHRIHGTHEVLAGARAMVTTRSRYTEDCLARAAGRGVTQYALLGAGLDTFAWRSPLAARVRVIEADHPGCAPGTELVAEYLVPDDLQDDRGRTYTRLVASAAAAQGEPWRTLLRPDEMSALLAAHGFTPVTNLPQRATVDRALWDRSDALRPSALSWLARARRAG
jgi:O-methyltransferase involved in polyketide biosynthesis